MRDGIVQSGNTTHLYGNSATQFMASQSAAYCLDQTEAEEKVWRSRGSFREALIFYLGERGFAMPSELLERLTKRDAEEAAIGKAVALGRFKEKFCSKILKVAKRTLAAPCTFCNQLITPTQTYFGMGDKKAHSACCRTA